MMPKMALNTIQETLKPISAMEVVVAFLSMRNSAKPSLKDCNSSIDIKMSHVYFLLYVYFGL